MTTPLGNKGVRQDILVVVGATYGPYPVFFTKPDGTDVDVTNCTLIAAARRKASDEVALITFDCPLVDPTTAPQFTFGLAVDATEGVECGDDARDPLSHAVWGMALVDSTGRVIPVCYGNVKLVREVPRAA